MLFEDLKSNLKFENLTNESLIKFIENNVIPEEARVKAKTDGAADKTKQDNSKNDVDITLLNNEFISCFLGLLHEEGNKYISMLTKTSINNDFNELSLNASTAATPAANRQNHGANMKSTEKQPYITPRSNFKQSRKVTLQPLTNSPNINIKLNDQFISPNNNFNIKPNTNSSGGNGNNSWHRRSSNQNLTFSSPINCVGNNIIPPSTPSFANQSFSQSPNNYQSPRWQQQNSYMRAPMKPSTLFDYISTPIKSPTKTKQQENEMQMNDTNSNCAEIVNDENNKLKLKHNAKDLGLIVEKALDKDEMLKLKIIAKFYSELILNIGKKMKVFKSIESCIYFSINAICNLECVLKHLKSSTILELQQNIYVQTFKYLFPTNSCIINHCLSADELKLKSRLELSELKQVPFYADIHVRENFPMHSDHLFVTFKAQRDTFYDILYDWEKNHKSENWNFIEIHGQQIKDLVYSESNSANCLCFVKLFQEQLILMCKHDKLFIDKKDAEINGPDHIKAAYDPVKLKRLNARMSTPNPNYGPNPAPKFTGYQEFFKEFIDIASSPVFNQLLMDNLNLEVHKIHEEIPNVEDGNENSINKATIEDTLLKLRIIGKFSGYVVFFPYQTVFTPNYLKKDISTARNINFPLNVKNYVEKAIQQKHLILTIPFVVEFLSMMDENAMSIEIIKDTFSLLIYIFRSQSLKIKTDNFTIDKMFLLFCIAWLLQLKMIVSYNQLTINKDLNFKVNKTGLDDLNLITPVLLHYCCPYLDELHKLLIRFGSGIKRTLQQINNVSNIYGFKILNITPKSHIDVKQLQTKMETQFFHLHPNLKRVIDFVSERVISNYIRIYKQNTFKLQLNEMKEEFISQHANESIDDLDNHIRHFCLKCAKDFTNKCLDTGKEYCEPKLNDLIMLTIDEFTPKDVFNVTLCLSVRATLQKLNQWIKINLNENIFYEEFKNRDFRKRLLERSLLSVSTTIDLDQTKFCNNTIMDIKDEDVNDVYNHVTISELFNEIRSCMKTLNTKPSVDLAYVYETMEKILNASQYCTNMLKGYLAQLTSEIMVLLVSTQCTHLNTQMMDLYYKIEYVANSNNYAVIFRRLLCKRNMFLIKTSPHPTATKNFKDITDYLIGKYSTFMSEFEVNYYSQSITNYYHH